MENFPTISRAWRAEYRLLTLFFISLIGSVWVSYYMPWSVIEGELFRIGRTVYILRLPLFWLIPVSFLLVILLRKYDAVYRFTTTDIEAKTGILGVNLKKVTIRYEDVKSVQLTQTLEQRLFNIGDIDISSASSSGIEIQILGVYNPTEIKRFIDNEKNMRIHSSLNLKDKLEEEEIEEKTKDDPSTSTEKPLSVKRMRTKKVCYLIFASLTLSNFIFFELVNQIAKAQTTSLLSDNIRSSLNKPEVFVINKKIDAVLSEEEEKLRQAEEKLTAKSLAEINPPATVNPPIKPVVKDVKVSSQIKPESKKITEQKSVKSTVSEIKTPPKSKVITNKIPPSKPLVANKIKKEPMASLPNRISINSFSGNRITSEPTNSELQSELKAERERLRSVVKKMDQLSAKLAFAETEIERLTLLSAECGSSRVKVFKGRSEPSILPSGNSLTNRGEDRIVVAVVSAPKLNLRTGPGLNFPPLLQVKRGTSLIVESQSDNWIKVVTPTGAYAWGNQSGFDIIDEKMNQDPINVQNSGYQDSKVVAKNPRDREAEALNLIKTWKLDP
jgi:Bacterial PH domain